MIPAQAERHTLTTNPFPGLRPFRIEESHLFFGREGQTDEVLLKLARHRFVAIVGPSGSGKSSFIYCGVLPILYGGFLTEAGSGWEVIVTRPGHAPIDNLAEAVLKKDAQYAADDEEEKKIKRTIFSTLLRSSSLGLVEAVRHASGKRDVKYLVLVDQFEELFRYKDGQDANAVNEALAFVNLLLEASSNKEAPIYVALTMRSDFIGDCAQYPELTSRINDSHYLIPQLTREQKRSAIEGPVAVGGGRITPRLVQQLLNDLGDNPDQLPILQHALMRTWNYWMENRESEDEPIDLKHYEAIGTMSEALSLHANEAYDELDEQQKVICEILFKAITEKRGENFGVRRPTRLEEIAAIANVSEEEVIRVIDKFRDPGRSLLTPAHGVPLTSRSMIDISHESLMRIWTRLKGWVEDEAEAAQIYIRLSEAAAMYQVGKAGLWRPPDLQLALNWQKKYNPGIVWGRRYNPAFERTMIFLEYSKKEWETEQRIKELRQKRKLKAARIVALILGSLTLVALLALVFAFLKQTEAIRNAEALAIEVVKSDSARREAERQREYALEQQRIAEEQEAYALQQQKVAEEQRQVAIEQRRIAEAQRAIALVNERRARENAEIADRERVRAEANEKRAIENAERAQREEQRARELRYRAIAKAMAIKSIQLNDREQEALLAQQAYNFNTQFKGYPYDNDIYDGLYNALKKFGDPLTANLTGHKNNVRSLVTSPQGKTIYSGGAEGKIIQWTNRGGTWTGQVIVQEASYRLIACMDVSRDGRWLIAGGNFNASDPRRNFVELYDLQSPGKPAKVFRGFVGEVGHIRFTPDSKGFYARDNEGYTVRYCDLNTVKEVITSKEKIRSIDISSDGRELAVVTDEEKSGQLIVWNLNTMTSQLVYTNEGEGLYAVAFGPEEETVVIGAANGLVRILKGGSVARELSGHESAIQDIRFNHAGNFMATASKDKTVRLWNLQNLKEQPIKLYDHPNWVWSIAFSPDDEQLLAGTQEQVIKSWPTRVETMSGKLCGMVTRNMTKDEWDIFVSEDLEYVETCEQFSTATKIK
ncbi:MAG: High-affnity carbon uptake protein Hat/HatR [Bacteroidota bacterium]|jgi:WD40 repeat protein